MKMTVSLSVTKVYLLLIGLLAFSFNIGLAQGTASRYSSDWNAQYDNCNTLPKTFTSYEEALRLVRGTRFKLTDKVDTSSSSWVRGATFYSCDSNVGFLIIRTDKKDYIHQNVPISIWKGFKGVSSFGTYYANNIKGNYQLQLR